jgi:hypothetical protein
MMQQLGARTVHDATALRRRTSSSDRPGRMMLVSIPPEHMPPVSFGSTLFQRLRVVIFRDGDRDDGGSFDDINPAQVLGELPLLRAAAAMAASSARPAPRPRRLQGELLCDEAGRLYEKIGNFVRPIHQLVAGPRGEVLDLAPPSKSSLRGTANAVIDVPDAEVVDVTADDDEGPPAAGYRELTPRSAQPRIVRFGEFKTILGPQLLHPERLRDTHRLPCRVRVFESAKRAQLDAFATEILGGASTQLLPLTPALAARLDVGELMAPRRASQPRDREPGWILPNERVVLLTVLHDPTATTQVGPVGQVSQVGQMGQVGDVLRALRNTIPDRFLAPWQFVFSRDEAIYDVEQQASRPLRSFVNRLIGAWVGGRQRRRWQSLLTGKSVDEQLWAVRPPRGWLTSAAVRAWARRTLEAGGYDANVMLREWQIYWQRKGDGSKAR